MAKYTICVYGAASEEINPVFMRRTEELGREIARRKLKLIYGGGATGLMGACARGCAQAGGSVVGVIPRFMKDYENINNNCTELVYTETMADRKQVMEDNADAFIIAPGGIGTLDEFFQILTLSELDRHRKPIILFNINGFYDDVIRVIKKGITMKFVRPIVRHLFAVTSDPVQALELIREQLSEPSE